MYRTRNVSASAVLLALLLASYPLYAYCDVKHAGQPSDDRKRDIEQEEVYRNEVRLYLSNTEKPFYDTVLSFFNSPLGLWILSSVLVTVFTASWTSIRNRRDAHEKVRARLRLIRLELAFRVMAFEKALTRYIENSTYYFAACRQILMDCFINPEFSNWSTEALLMEAYLTAAGGAKEPVAPLLHSFRKAASLVVLKDNDEHLAQDGPIDFTARKSIVNDKFRSVIDEIKLSLQNWNP